MMRNDQVEKLYDRLKPYEDRDSNYIMFSLSKTDLCIILDALMKRMVLAEMLEEGRHND